jgi:hypothetical protein
MNDLTLESLAQRLAVIEQRLGIKPEQKPTPPPPGMSRPGYQSYDPAQQLRDRIAGFEAELAEWQTKIAAFERGEDPNYPEGPAGRFRPSYGQQAEVCEANIRSFEERLSMVSGKARPLTQSK